MIFKSCLDTFMEKQFLFLFVKLFVLSTAFAVFPTRVSLYLNDLFGTYSFVNYHKLPDVSE